MTEHRTRHRGDPSIRATYEEYDLADTTVGMISDPENAHAWIQSDVTVLNEP